MAGPPHQPIHSPSKDERTVDEEDWLKTDSDLLDPEFSDEAGSEEQSERSNDL